MDTQQKISTINAALASKYTPDFAKPKLLAQLNALKAETASPSTPQNQEPERKYSFIYEQGTGGKYIKTFMTFPESRGIKKSQGESYVEGLNSYHLTDAAFEKLKKQYPNFAYGDNNSLNSSSLDKNAVHILPKPRPKKTEVKTKYHKNSEINAVTVLEKGLPVTYSGKDVLNGANVMEPGGELADKAKFYAVRNIVSVQLNSGEAIKPKNGYWIKKGAAPILHAGGELTGINQHYLVTNYFEKGGAVTQMPDITGRFVKFFYPGETMPDFARISSAAFSDNRQRVIITLDDKTVIRFDKSNLQDFLMGNKTDSDQDDVWLLPENIQRPYAEVYKSGGVVHGKRFLNSVDKMKDKWVELKHADWRRGEKLYIEDIAHQKSKQGDYFIFSLQGRKVEIPADKIPMFQAGNEINVFDDKRKYSIKILNRSRRYRMTGAKKTGSPVFDKAKEIRRAGETWPEAVSRAAKLLKN